MLGIERLVESAEVAIASSRADQTEVVLFATEKALTRFANNAIHQNVASENVRATVRVVLPQEEGKGRRTGSACADSLDCETMRVLARDAYDVASTLPVRSDLTSLPGPSSYTKLDVFAFSTAECTAELRAGMVADMIEIVRRRNLVCSGALSTESYEVLVVNSLGVRAYHAGTWAELNCTVSSEDSWGYAARCSSDIEALDHIAVAQEAAEKCARGRHPEEIEPGRYDVILEEYALEEIMNWLSFTSLGATSLEEGSSFMTNRFGEKLLSEKITIYDDAHDKRIKAMPFDFEGVPKQKVMIVEKGIARGVVHNSLTAARMGTKSTGHAMPMAWGTSVFPTHLHLEGGDSSKDEMLEMVEHGIWVTRFHYINGLLEPRKAVFTGLTRGGTFLIKNGRIVKPLRNLRFTESIVHAFSNVEAVSRDTMAVSMGWHGTGVMPVILIRNFNFTDQTDF